MWRGVVVALAALALVVGGISIGWIAVLGTAAGMAVTGAVVSFAWVQEPRRRWRAMSDLALWFGIGAVLMLGLPVAFGPWALFLLIAIGVTCPPLLDLAVRELRQRRPVASTGTVHRLEAGDLERRWVRTSRELRDRRGDVQAVLALVQERERLLDEIERRDPAAFDAVLVRAGWREPQDR
ncbi:hypothetical protein GCM10009606_28820 [Nocardioides aquiterrae]|uniref:Uncharacterized protein n=1 Tax=Nocardioides aquiterrae TaxID=203799 RepID=A0ABN1UEZ6_9ACTN